MTWKAETKTRLAELINEKFPGKGGRSRMAALCGIPGESLSRYTRSDAELRRAAWWKIERMADILDVDNPRDLFGPMKHAAPREGEIVGVPCREH